MKRDLVIMLCAGLTALGCDSGAPAPSAEPPARSAAPGASSADALPAPGAAGVDPKAVEAATGGKAEVTEGIAKVSFPRDDVKVDVDGWTMPPFMGLTSWAAFSPATKPGVEAMVMGDLVLFEDEVSDAMSAALARPSTATSPSPRTSCSRCSRRSAAAGSTWSRSTTT